NLFFKRKGLQFLARSAEQVSTELTRRQRQREREEFRAHASGIINQLLAKKTAPIPHEAEPILDRMQNCLRYRTGDEGGGLLEELVGPAKARDAAYDILLRAGRLDPTVDRFLAMAGIGTEFGAPVIEAAEHLHPYVHNDSRLDYQDAFTFTIDDEDTREVDDAL